jgi:hypothetical protein
LYLFPSNQKSKEEERLEFRQMDIPGILSKGPLTQMMVLGIVTHFRVFHTWNGCDD